MVNPVSRAASPILTLAIIRRSGVSVVSIVREHGREALQPGDVLEQLLRTRDFGRDPILSPASQTLPGIRPLPPDRSSKPAARFDRYLLGPRCHSQAGADLQSATSTYAVPLRAEAPPYPAVVPSTVCPIRPAASADPCTRCNVKDAPRHRRSGLRRCGGSMRILAVLPAGEASGAILEHLELPTKATFPHTRATRSPV
jgi:hypothetical protein